MQYRLGLYEKAMPAALGWEEKFAAARTCGFDFLEISIDESDEKLARLDQRESWREMRQAADKAACPALTMCLSGHRRYPLGSEDRETRTRALVIMAGALEMAAYLGIRVIQMAGYDVYYSASTRKTRALFAEGLARVTEMAAGHGVLLGFETMETAFMDTVRKAMKYVRALHSPCLQIYPDIGNLTNAAALYGHDLCADIASGRGHIIAAHLKESRPGQYREVPFGAGHVAFTPAIRAFLRQGVRIFVGEFWYAGSRDWRADLRSASAFLRNHIGLAAGEAAK